MLKKNFKIILVLLFIFSNQVFAIEDLILRSESSFIPTHQNRFSLLLGVNPSLQKSSDISNIAFSFGKKLDSFWLDTNILLTNGVFNKMTTNNPAATGLTNEQLFDTKSSMSSIGIGIARESRYAQTLLPFNDLYESMAADITYNIYKEINSGKTFTGPGMIAKFSLYKRFSDYFSAGTQFTYNLASLKRVAADDLETSSSRSLTISYITIGFELNLYL